MSEKNGNRPYDEQTLAKVLEAAYVLQEHNRAREEKARDAERATALPTAAGKPAIPATTPQAAVPAKKAARPPAPKDYALVLAQIVDTQHSIQLQQLELEPAIAIIAARAAEIARADGAGIAILEGVNVRYAAATGIMALPVGTEVLMEKALCAASLRVGHVVRCADINVEFLVDLEECRRRGIQAMIAAPVFVSGNVAGALELYYSASNEFVEQDVHTCQLMAGLVGEALARKQGLTLAKSQHNETEAAITGPEKMGEAVLAKNSLATPNSRQPTSIVGTCHNCGAEIVDDEQFCGTCGLPVGATVPALNGNSLLTGTGSTPAKTAAERAPAARDSSNWTRPADFEAFVGPYAPKADEPEFELPGNVEAPENEVDGKPVSADQGGTAAEAANWSSAAEAREFLEKFAAGHGKNSLVRFLKARRGDIYLALALVLVAIVIRWGIWSGHPVNSAANPPAGHRQPESDLPLYDRLLIKFGLAEAPDPPEYRGNPDTQVWVDVQTGLYYCSGADLYGKTPKGKVTSQRTAQMDQYEPAARKPCD